MNVVRRFAPSLVVIAVLAGAGAAAAGAAHLSPVAKSAAATSGRSTQLSLVAKSAAATSGRSTQLSLVSEPAAGNAPFLKLIRGARHTIELTMYELYDTQVEDALAGAAARHVDVRVLLNGGYYGNREESNGTAFSYLKRHHVHVQYTPSYFALTHQKTLTADGRESAIMTLNFDGEYATTRDFAILDRQRADVKAIVATFNADWSGRQITASTGSGDLIWSPGAAPAFTSMINSAKHSLDVENEEMDYTPVTDDLCAAARRHVKVHIVMTYSSDSSSALGKLRSCGVGVHLYHGQSYYIHAKLLIADGRAAIISSQNFSTTSLDYNRELGIRVRDHAIVSALTRDFNSDYTHA